MLQAQDSRETLREKVCCKMKAFVSPWVYRAACLLTAKGQALPGLPLPRLNFPGFPSRLAQILLVMLLPADADAGLSLKESLLLSIFQENASYHPLIISC